MWNPDGIMCLYLTISSDVFTLSVMTFNMEESSVLCGTEFIFSQFKHTRINLCENLQNMFAYIGIIIEIYLIER